MVKLVLRDDDCNFFTRVEDIESVYRDISFFPVTFAVVPTVTDCYGGCPETKNNTTPRFVGDNKELTDYLKQRVGKGSCDICMHGITHGYKFTSKGMKIPEMQWRENEDTQLEKEIGLHKNQLEQLFETSINWFVAPSNRLMRNGIRAVYRNAMNYSGIIPIDFQRDYTLKSLYNYNKRFIIRALYGLPYPGVLDYGTHKELNACNTINYDYLIRMFHYCEKMNSPMAINVHYWHMRDYPESYDDLFRFVRYSIDHGAIPSRMRDCL